MLDDTPIPKTREMKRTKLQIAKDKMKEYKDFFGGQFINQNQIEEAKTVSELEVIFQNHHDYITDMSTDAQASLNRFKKSLKIFN